MDDQIDDMRAWRQGIYFINAINHCFSENCPYPNCPMSFDSNSKLGNRDGESSYDAERAAIESQVLRVSAAFKRGKKSSNTKA